MKMRKAAALGMAVISIISLLAGCSSKSGTGADISAGATEGEKVTITIYQSKIEANEGYQKAIEAYKSVHPEVTINLEAVTGNDFAASLKAKMQSDPPTIFSVGGFQDLKDY